jgi:hypothetical protein
MNRFQNLQNKLQSTVQGINANLTDGATRCGLIVLLLEHALPKLTTPYNIRPLQDPATA